MRVVWVPLARHVCEKVSILADCAPLLEKNDEELIIKSSYEASSCREGKIYRSLCRGIPPTVGLKKSRPFSSRYAGEAPSSLLRRSVATHGDLMHIDIH